MELAYVERALKRPGEYLFEDGLWEVVAGLWIGLTVALPQFVGGAVANWAPVVWLQFRAAKLAQQAADGDGVLSDDYRKTVRLWFILGWPAFLALLAIFWLMVAKPNLW